MVTRTLRSTFTGSFAALAVAGGLVFATAVPSQAAEVQVAADAGVSVQTIANERQALAAQAAQTAEAREALEGMASSADLSAETPKTRVQLTVPDTSAPTTVRTAGSATAAAPAPSGTARAQVVVGSNVVETARQFLGVPYVWGGTTPAGFDCSGLVQYVYGLHGVSLPRTDAAQKAAGTVIDPDQAQPGDLVWHPGHIGIYAGNGMVIHAPRPGKSVEIIPLQYFGAVTFVQI